MRARSGLMPLMLAGCAFTSAESPPTHRAEVLRIQVGLADHGCSLTVEGSAMTGPDFAQFAAQQRQRYARAEIVTDDRSPYRCIGGVVFTLQRLRYPIKYILH